MRDVAYWVLFVVTAWFAAGSLYYVDPVGAILVAVPFSLLTLARERRRA